MILNAPEPATPFQHLANAMTSIQTGPTDAFTRVRPEGPCKRLWVIVFYTGWKQSAQTRTSCHMLASKQASTSEFCRKSICTKECEEMSERGG